MAEAEKYLVLDKPEVEQDPDTGAVYVTLRKGPEVARTIMLAQDMEIMADLDEEGNILGVEIL